jgi:hypothetical protein
MKDFALFILVAILAFMLWNNQKMPGETYVQTADAVSPAVIQSIANSVQAMYPDVYPVQTIYINPLAGSQGSQIYNARMVFINTRGYFGIQYDIQADKSGKILSISELPVTSVGDVFQPYADEVKYSAFSDTQAVLDQQFSELKTQVPGYQGKLDTWLEQLRSNQFAAADRAARDVNSSYYESVENVRAQGYGNDNVFLS